MSDFSQSAHYRKYPDENNLDFFHSFYYNNKMPLWMRDENTFILYKYRIHRLFVPKFFLDRRNTFFLKKIKIHKRT